MIKRSSDYALPRPVRPSTGRRWWENGVVYQIYPRSWADSNGDGVGDIEGIRQRLDHLSWLGVDAIWLNPMTPSPNCDWGYDVSDYCDVHPDYGALPALERLVHDCNGRGIAVVLDLVPNHTSWEHPWFHASRSGDAGFRDWYVWNRGDGDGGPPNNWVSALGGGPAWTFDPVAESYYLHSFLPAQPDLNWWHEDVRLAFDDILRFWFDRGIAGFRIDVVHALIHDRDLRGNPPVTPEDHPQVQRLGQRQIHNMNRPETHEIVKRWRRIADSYDPPRVLVGETYLFELADVAAFYGEGDELHLAFNFPFIFSDFSASALAAIVAATQRAMPAGEAAAWAVSNHDVGRVMSRWCDGDVRKARCAMLLLLTLPGCAFLYYGDEIGMSDVSIAPERVRDPAGVGGRPGRDRARTPMQWSPRPGAGFTDGATETWLPLGDHLMCNVADQLPFDRSYLALTRELIGLRRAREDLQSGEYREVTVSRGLWGFRRGDATEVWLNLSDQIRRLHASGRQLLLRTGADPATPLNAPLELGPWEAAITESGREI